ncbi:MAG: hypothetical protein KA004_05105 [Verrucomicrobiales bacterium]|nr:hypothetical protein [Verrucomicrobiales bacterium]
MEKPRPTLHHRPPAPLFGTPPDGIRQLHDDLMLKSIKETHEALLKWNEYFSEFRETTVNDTDGDVYILLAKDIREEPQGRCPFVLRAKRLSGDDWEGTEAPGVVIFEDTDGTLTPVIPTYEGTPLTSLPTFTIQPDQSTWHVHIRDETGMLTAVHVMIGESEPSLSEGETALKIATLKKDGTKYTIATSVAGVYVLGRGGGISSSSSSSGSLSSSGSGSSSAKSAIVPFRDGFIGWFAVERPEAVFEDTTAIQLDHHGEGIALLPPEFLASVRRETIIMTSVLPDAPAPCSGRVERLGPNFPYLLVRAPSAGKAIVRYEGVANGSPPRWKRYTAAQAKSNREFYAMARNPKMLEKFLRP